MNNADMPAMPGFLQTDFTPGLTKREYFAGLAMQGLLSGIPAEGIIDYGEVADDAKRCADALLAQLERTK